MPKPEEIDFGFTINEKELWQKNIVAEYMALSELDQNLDIAYLEKAGTDDWNLTLRQLIVNPILAPDHYEKIKTVDLSYPIEIFFYKGSWKILDGVHRYGKAVLLGCESIKVRKHVNLI